MRRMSHLALALALALALDCRDTARRVDDSFSVQRAAAARSAQRALVKTTALAAGTGRHFFFDWA
jgi:hypothetical protein